MPRLLGGEIEMVAYRLETILAEKGVTILERGITSTRWRDYVDIVRLARSNTIDRGLLLDAARAVARFRGVELEPIAGHVVGYGEVGQARWAAWRRKEQLEESCEERLDDQMRLVAEVIDPVFVTGPG